MNQIQLQHCYMFVHRKFSNTDEKLSEMKSIPYQEDIGSWMYSEQFSRPHIVLSVEALVR